MIKRWNILLIRLWKIGRDQKVNEMTKIKQNNIESFSQKTIKAIKYYVYALVNPKTENIFYIGKGSKNRCFKSWKEQNQKKDFIPRIDIIRYGLSEEDALEVEAASGSNR